LYKFVTCIFIYISVTFIVFAATMFMVNKDYHSVSPRQHNTPLTGDCTAVALNETAANARL